MSNYFFLNCYKFQILPNPNYLVTEQILQDFRVFMFLFYRLRNRTFSALRRQSQCHL